MLATGLEPKLILLSTYLCGLSQKCVVAAIKKWKETNDQRNAEGKKHTIDEHESAKSVSTKIEQQITVSIRSLKGVKFWIITEADRSATTVLLPDDY